MKIVKWILIALVSGILVTFALVNRTQVTLALFPLPFEADIPVFLLIFLTLIAGSLLGGLSCLSYAFSCLRKARLLTARLAAVEQELAALKAASRIVESVSEKNVTTLPNE